MSTFKYVGVLVLATTCACSDALPTAPNAPVPPPAPTYTVTGTVIDGETLQPIAGATVTLSDGHPARPVTTDANGAFSVGAIWGQMFDIASVAEGYDPTIQFISNSTTTLRLHRTLRVTVGTSATVTVSGSDSLCVNDAHDDILVGLALGMSPYVCRLVRVSAPSDGVMTVRVRSAGSATPAQFEVEVRPDRKCCWWQRDPAAPIDVATGDELTIYILNAPGAPAQTFTLTTEFTPK